MHSDPPIKENYLLAKATLLNLNLFIAIFVFQIFWYGIHTFFPAKLKMLALIDMYKFCKENRGVFQVFLKIL